METKSVFKSKTVGGIVLMLLPHLIDAASTGLLGPKVQAAMVGVGAVLALYGRITAKKPIRMPKVKPTTAIPLFMALFVGSMMLGGCQLFSGHEGMTPDEIALQEARQELIAKTGVQYATAKVLENNPDYAERIASIAGGIREVAAGDGANTVALLMQMARDKIDWDKLSKSPADVVAVNLLLDAVQLELTARLGEGVLPPDKALVVGKVAGWIEGTARLYMPQ